MLMHPEQKWRVDQQQAFDVFGIGQAISGIAQAGGQIGAAEIQAQAAEAAAKYQAAAAQYAADQQRQATEETLAFDRQQMQQAESDYQQTQKANYDQQQAAAKSTYDWQAAKQGQINSLGSKLYNMPGLSVPAFNYPAYAGPTANPGTQTSFTNTSTVPTINGTGPYTKDQLAQMAANGGIVPGSPNDQLLKQYGIPNPLDTQSAPVTTPPPASGMTLGSAIQMPQAFTFGQGVYR